MTKNLPARQRSAEVAAPAGASAAPSVAIGKHLAPLRELRQAESWALALQQFVGRVADCQADSDVPDGFLEAMGADRDALPPASERRALRRALGEARSAEATHGDLARIVGGMFDGLATFDANRSPGAIDSFMLVSEVELDEIPTHPLALALAAVDVLRNMRWAPTPGEFLDRVRAAERRLGTAVRLLDAIDPAITRLAQLEAANTPEARARRQAERQAEAERRRAFAERMQEEIRGWSIDGGRDPAA